MQKCGRKIARIASEATGGTAKSFSVRAAAVTVAFADCIRKRR